MRTTRFPLALALALAALAFTPTPTFAADEICGNGVDDNADGTVDETPCVPQAPPPPGSAPASSGPPAPAATPAPGSAPASGPAASAPAPSSSSGPAAPGSAPASGPAAPGSAPAASPAPPAPAAGSGSAPAPSGVHVHPAASPATAKKATDPAALALRWGAVADAAGNITCSTTLPGGTAVNCWSPDYGKPGKAWDWSAAPARYSITRSRQLGHPVYLTEGAFFALEVEKGLVADRHLNEERIVVLETASGEHGELIAAHTLQLADIDAAIASRNTEIGTITERQDTLDREFDALKLRMSEAEGRIEDHEIRIVALEDSDVKQNRALAHLLRNAVPYLDGYAGLTFLAGEPVLTTLPVLDEDGNETEETEDWFHRHDRTSQFAVGGTVGLADGELGHGLQLSGTLSWGQDTGGTGLNFSLLGGPMFRLGADGVVGGIRGGLNVSQSGIRDGDNLSSATGGAFVLSLLLTPPMPFLPQFRLDMGAVVERVRYDDLDGTHRPTMGRFLLQVTGGFGGTIKQSPVPASDFDE